MINKTAQRQRIIQEGKSGLNKFIFVSLFGIISGTIVFVLNDDFYITLFPNLESYPVFAYKLFASGVLFFISFAGILLYFERKSVLKEDAEIKKENAYVDSIIDSDLEQDEKTKQLAAYYLKQLKKVKLTFRLMLIPFIISSFLGFVSPYIWIISLLLLLSLIPLSKKQQYYEGENLKLLGGFLKNKFSDFVSDINAKTQTKKEKVIGKNESNLDQLEKLSKLLEKGVITKKEFQAKKKKLLDSI